MYLKENSDTTQDTNMSSTSLTPSTTLGSSMAYFANCGPKFRLDSSFGQDVSAQFLLAVDYLHSSGIPHGGELIFIPRQLQSLTSWRRYLHGQHLIPQSRTGEPFT